MLSTCTDLLTYFPQATLAYTHSDEITLVFPTGVHSFGDRIQKLASLSASYCSVRFGEHLRRAVEREPLPKLKEGGMERISYAHFDARFFGVPSIEEALNCIIWRCRGDAVRNAVSGYARTMFSTKEMHKTTGKLKEMIKERLGGKTFEESVPAWAVEGCLVKRERFEHEGVNGKTGEREVTFRTRTRVEERGIKAFGEEGLRLISEKFW